MTVTAVYDRLRPIANSETSFETVSINAIAFVDMPNANIGVYLLEWPNFRKMVENISPFHHGENDDVIISYFSMHIKNRILGI